jgi:hypothetical protein
LKKSGAEKKWGIDARGIVSYNTGERKEVSVDMLAQTATPSGKTKIVPADLVAAKPDETFLWRQEMGKCRYDHKKQIRHWDESEIIHGMIMSTGSPSSSTTFDGESEE